MPIEAIAISAMLLSFALIPIVISYLEDHSRKALVWLIIIGMLFIGLTSWAILASCNKTYETIGEAKIVIINNCATFIDSKNVPHNANHLFNRQFQEGDVIILKHTKTSYGLNSYLYTYSVKNETKAEEVEWGTLFSQCVSH